MQSLWILAQVVNTSHESWLLIAVGLMIVFNIIWKPIERKLFPNDTLEKVMVLITLMQKQTEELLKMHDDKDPLTGQYRWKIPHELTKAIDNQTKLLQEMRDNSIQQLSELQGLKHSIQAMTNTLTRRYSNKTNIERKGT